MSRPRKPIQHLIKGTYYISLVGGKTEPIRSLILRRRLQLLVHSYLYYHQGENLVSDDTWTSWAKELYKLQKQYPHICSRVDYHRDFKDFDPSTGFSLPYLNPEIANKAEYLLRLHKEREEKNEKRKNHRKSGRAKRGSKKSRRF